MSMELFEYALRKAEELGIDEVELYYSSVRDYELELSLGAIPKMRINFDQGAGLRVVKDNRIGFSYLTDLTKESIETSLKNGLSSAKASKPVRDWPGFPEEQKYPSVKGLYDKKIAEFDTEFLLDSSYYIANELTLRDRRIKPTYIGAGMGLTEKIIINSNGVNVKQTGTYIYIYAVAIGIEGTRRTPMLASFDASRVKEVDEEKVVSDLLEKVKKTLNKGKGESEKATVIFHPQALSEIANYTLRKALSGEQLHRGRTPFKNKIGETVAVDELTIIDDGTLPKALNSGIADDEGVPMQKKTLIERGVLKTFYFDYYTGKLLKGESTGNGIRVSGPAGSLPQYASLPQPDVTNVVIENGDIKLENMVSEIENGYLLVGTQGAHSSNPESGEFSVAGAPLWRIEKGEIIGSVDGAMISGNVYEMLNRVVAISKEREKLFNAIMPYVAFKDVNVITK